MIPQQNTSKQQDATQSFSSMSERYPLTLPLDFPSQQRTHRVATYKESWGQKFASNFFIRLKVHPADKRRFTLPRLPHGCIG
ncbi:hypothetical protein [Paenibacillus hexagrammi]|uniref:Uncharacterized protein n=1 Tax=Paenibacillus hexagrammi TaxID=2908839 RepID=A0ABY3SFG0_9BACL|nr:hypothetical protein [Paenibacillus sp. YPD9-1]UJF32165.1 hypothetical protein L0M14_20895 [Paenibacillus sp. YPD9-1]